MFTMSSFILRNKVTGTVWKTKAIQHQCFSSTGLKRAQLNLLKTEAFINGKWVSAKSGKTFQVTNPATGQVIASVPDMDVTDTKVAIEAANEAFKTWGKTTAKERSVLLRKWYDAMVAHANDLAALVTAEAGKPLPEALGEVNYGNSFVEWFSEEARRVNGDIIQSPQRSKEMMMIKQPIGVAALITPWNFPQAMITRKAGAALAAGCTCVIKPAEDTPFTALALAELAQQVGIPDGVINVVTSDRSNAPGIGNELCTSPHVAGLSFTGSTEVGKLLYKQCASGVKRVGLELGGNAPFIVFESADLDKAVEGAIASKFRNCGQTCVSANRFLIQDKVFDAFVQKLKDKMATLKLGDGTKPDVNQGPLINMKQVEKVESIVKDAVDKGATVVYGGKPASNVGPQFYEPTLLTNIKPNMVCYTEEIFGPIAVCIKFQTEEEAVDIGNSTNRGLAGYFYSNNVSQVWKVAKLLEVGMVGVNEGLISSAEAAFGGIKESGIGREGSHYGLEEYTYIKYICFGNLQ
ncbi:glutarate-semialdehyde dehydrogenase [Macrosteles quadrilineatus]|uniref:glutarate-semialdehyde dehydrogenase n=1 Tax=Macrosteles quadrilineatus TaxID=74068 RepID=UPI0023E1FF2C|nr:glutarate-semialdehyde dehydrogenase [Macrosteles quadrilineatus]